LSLEKQIDMEYHLLGLMYTALVIVVL
jgi:hypothetical protein